MKGGRPGGREEGGGRGGEAITCPPNPLILISAPKGLLIYVETLLYLLTYT